MLYGKLIKQHIGNITYTEKELKSACVSNEMTKDTFKSLIKEMGKVESIRYIVLTVKDTMHILNNKLKMPISL